MNLPISKYGSLLSFVLILSTTVLTMFGFKPVAAKNIVRVDELPMQIGEWTGKDTVGLGLRELDVLKLNKYVRRVYTRPTGESVLVYIGYWSKQSGDHQAAKHSPATCLPANGWNTFGREAVTLKLNLPEGPPELTVNKIIGDFKNDKKVFYYWFFAGTEHYYKDWQSLLRISLRNALGQRSDGGIVDLTVDIPGETFEASEAEAVLQDFVSDLMPLLQAKILETEN